MIIISWQILTAVEKVLKTGVGIELHDQNTIIKLISCADDKFLVPS